MEVFVRDEEIKENKLDMKKHPKNEVVLTKWIISNEELGDAYDSEEYCIDIKSLDQHDAEVKKQVVEELREFLLKDLTLYTPHSFEYDNPDLRLFREREKVTNDLEQKLAELEKTPQCKGEKDE